MNNLKKEYLNYLEQTTGKKDNSIVSFFRKANDFEVEYNIEIEKFTEDDIKSFLKFFARTSPNSLSVYFSRLKKYYQYLYKEKNITSLMQYTNMKYADYKDFVATDVYNSRILTREELYSQIGKIINPCDRLLLLLIFLGIKGDKTVELLNLKKSDIDLTARRITVGNTYYAIDSLIESEIRNTINTHIYYMNNGQGDAATQRKNRVELIENSDYIFRPIENKLPLKRDVTSFKKLTPQSIQRRVLGILHHVLGYPNMTLQTLYVAGVIQRLADYTEATGEVLTNLEVRQWIDNNNISVTKQEVYKFYCDRISNSVAPVGQNINISNNNDDDGDILAKNQITFTSLL